tara:strand:+ start:334 stop:555 length:222 start_codon:yes stop_codon:yes gene_type:complete
MKDKMLWWVTLGGVLSAEAYLIYEISQMMNKPVQKVVEVEINDIDHDVDESVDENMYYQTLWREKQKNDKSDK